jgi:protoporphyrinogen oxidase
LHSVTWLSSAYRLHWTPTLNETTGLTRSWPSTSIPRSPDWPIARSYIDRLLGYRWSPAATVRGSAENFEAACLQMMPREIYERFVKGYSEKQWGVPAHALAASLAGRFDAPRRARILQLAADAEALEGMRVHAFVDCLVP